MHVPATHITKLANELLPRKSVQHVFIKITKCILKTDKSSGPFGKNITQVCNKINSQGKP